jgi:catalase
MARWIAQEGLSLDVCSAGEIAVARNIVANLSDEVERFIQERAVRDYWAKVDSDLGARVAEGLGLQFRRDSRPPAN